MEYYPNYQLYQYASFNQGQYNQSQALQYHANAEAWRRQAIMHHGVRSTETKPRLAKEEVDKLEREFQRNHKPNSSLKKQLAEEMRVDIARINNWFQNRRAKAKQEKRTMENEARRKTEQVAEKSDEEVVKEYYPDNDHHDDLRPSVAPFPSSHDSTDSGTLVSLTLDQATGLPNDTASDCSPPNSGILRARDTISNDYQVTEGMFFSPDSPCDFASMSSSENLERPMPAPLAITIPDHFNADIQDTSTANSFASFHGFAEDELSALSMTYSSNSPAEMSKLGMGPDHTRSGGTFNLDQLSPDSAHSPMSAVSSAPFKSPPIDIAGRRNTKRPAQLGIGCMRSYSYNQAGMKTGMEPSRRIEIPSPMRRVASATGSLPRGIQKPGSAAPRSPMFFDRNQENMLLQMASRTPVALTPHNSAAPPTPNTPVLGSQPDATELMTRSTSVDQDKQGLFQPDMPSSTFQLDPTMRTPPDTPGLIGDFSGAVFSNNHFQTTYGYNITDEPLVTPGLGGFENEFPPVSTTLPSYVMQSCNSQPTTPSFPTTSAMGPAFFPSYSGVNPEYNWSDTSDQPSPDQSRARQFQFTNMTAQDFHGE